MVSGKLTPRKIAPRLGPGFGLGLVLELGLGAIFLRSNCPRTVENIIMTIHKLSNSYSSFSGNVAVMNKYMINLIVCGIR